MGHFISQGEMEEFQDIADTFPDHHVNLNGGVLDDFRLIMEADIIVTAKSGYSHLAASLSESMIIALPFWGSYDYLPSVVMAREDLEDGLDIREFVEVWNRRPRRTRAL